MRSLPPLQAPVPRSDLEDGLAALALAGLERGERVGVALEREAVRDDPGRRDALFRWS